MNVRDIVASQKVAKHRKTYELRISMQEQEALSRQQMDSGT